MGDFTSKHRVYPVCRSFSPTAPDAYLIVPDGELRGIIYFAHGITEYALRHVGVFYKFCDEGYAVIANNIFGWNEHWYTKDGYNKYSAWEQVVKYGLLSVYYGKQKLREVGQEPYGLPVYGIGFSLGSYIVQRMRAIDEDLFNKVVLIGSGKPKTIDLLMGKCLLKPLSLIRNKETASRCVKSVFFSCYGKKFHNEGEFAWLVKDENVRRQYLNDDKCNRRISPTIMRILLDGMLSVFSYQGMYEASLSDSEILVLSGEEDPVGGFGKHVMSMCREFEKWGCRYKVITYQDSRHDILEEPGCRDYVVSDIIDFLSS